DWTIRQMERLPLVASEVSLGTGQQGSRPNQPSPPPRGASAASSAQPAPLAPPFWRLAFSGALAVIIPANAPLNGLSTAPATPPSLARLSAHPARPRPIPYAQPPLLTPLLNQ